MEKKFVIILKSFLFRTFIVGFIFALILFGLTFLFWDKWSFIVLTKFGVSRDELGKLVVNSFLHLRMFLIFVLLVPAIGLHWLGKSKHLLK